MWPSPQCAASARHFMGLTSDQSLYNLVVRAVELEVIPALCSLGIGLRPGSAGMPGHRVGDDRGVLPNAKQERRAAGAQEVDAAEI